MRIEKVPPLVCKECGSTYVMMTSDGIECDECGKKPQVFVKLSNETEFLYIQQKEIENNEAF
jgi:DNA-directed RNA polymerase subunit RPC12/RpoP